MGNLSALANNVVQTTPVGVIEAFAGVNAPAGWLFCDGSAVSRIQYPELFSALSTTYGSGDGSTTFNIPDLRGRMPFGKGTHADVSSLGQNEGASLANRRPKHQHTVYDPSHSHQQYLGWSGSGNVLPYWDGNTSRGIYGGGNGGPTSTGIKINPENASSSTSPLDAPPYLVVNYIIKAVADLPRGGWFYQNQPPVVTQLPSNPQIGEEVYHYISNTGRYLLRRWNGSSWSYVGNNILQILMTTDTGAGSHNLTSYGIVGDLTTTITTNGDSRIMVDGNLGSMQPGTGNAMAVVKCDYNNTSTSSSDFTNLVAGTSAEWSHNGYDLKNLPFSGMTGTLAAGTYTFRVKIKSIQGYVLQWNWHSMQDQISWLKLTEIGVV